MTIYVHRKMEGELFLGMYHDMVWCARSASPLDSQNFHIPDVLCNSTSKLHSPLLHSLKGKMIGCGSQWGIYCITNLQNKCWIGIVVNHSNVLISVRRSSLLDWKKDGNRTEPNCKRLNHQLWLHKF